MFVWDLNLYATDYAALGYERPAVTGPCAQPGCVAPATRCFEYILPAGLPAGKAPEAFCGAHNPRTKYERSPEALEFRPRELKETAMSPEEAQLPGEGWRFLGPDEIIQQGDEWRIGETWEIDTDAAGRTVRDERQACSRIVFRRRVMPDVILRDEKGQPSTAWKQSEGVVATGRKDDAGKLRYDLLPVEPLREVVRVLTFGAKHYAPDNWQLVPEWKWRYTRAAMSHIEKWRGGERNDAESGWGTHHLAHAVCCLLFLLWFELTAKPANMAGDEQPLDPNVHR